MPQVRKILRDYWARDPRIHWALALFGLLLIGLVWAVTTQRIAFERSEAIAHATRQNSNLVIAFEEHTIRTLKAADQVARFVRHEYAARGAKMDIARYIADGVIDSRLFNVISVVDEHGDLVLSSVPPVPVNYADRDHFKFHLQHGQDAFYIGKPVLGRLSGRWQIPMTRRIEKADGTFGGAVVLSVDPGYFTGFYGKADLGEQGLVTLVGLDGITRARRSGSKSSFGDDLRASPLFEHAARSPAGSHVSSASPDGVRRLYSYRILQEYPLVAVVGTSEAEVLAPFYERARIYYISAGLASVLLAIFAAGLMAALSRQKRAIEALGRSEAQFRATFDQAAVGIMHSSLDRRILRVNRKFCEMVGYSADELQQGSVQRIHHPEDTNADQDFEKRLVAGEIETFSFDKRYVRKDGSVFPARRTVSLARDEAGRPSYFIRVIEDISERKEAEEKLLHLAHYDTLTDLPNRALCYDRLSQSLIQSRRRNRSVCVLFIDLDRFKAVNDSLGHAAGDLLLQQVAGRLSACIRAGDTAGRLGGDEFVIILPEVAKPDDAGLLALKIIGALAKPFQLGKHPVRVTSSIGIATCPDDGEDVDSLIRNADAAMFRAKEGGRNGYRFYSAATAGSTLDTTASG